MVRHHARREIVFITMILCLTYYYRSTFNQKKDEIQSKNATKLAVGYRTRVTFFNTTQNDGNNI